uniref:Alpha/beta hydrolase n=1 Tax=Arcella intermedia TaxID=1963864 RepID=A0A6B2KZC1_9EUKA
MSMEINLEDTFWHMKHRQWSRLYRSSYGKPRLFVSTYLIFYLLLYGIYLYLQIGHFHKNNNSAYVLEYLLMGLISITAGLISPMLGRLVRLVLFEVYAFLNTFFIMNLYTKPSDYVPLGIGFGGLIFLTVMNLLFFPILVRAWTACTGGISPKIVISDGETVSNNNGRFEIEQKDLCYPPYKCIYEGAVVNGKPHGLGTWIDTSYQGELMSGYWANGIPVGPFESMENDTRNLLVNLRIIYGANGGGRYFLQRTPLAVGVACVETCVSGNFFKGYPMVGMLSGPTDVIDGQSIKRLLENGDYMHIDEEKTITSVTVSVDKKHRSLNVTGFHSDELRQMDVKISLKQKKAKSKKEKKIYYLSLNDAWKPSVGKEGILFIHGIYHTLEDALKRFGQFLALGHFPAHIKPFCFNWPASTNPLMYWCASSVASDNDTHRDLLKFLKMLKKAGIEKLHVMCHSMGTRFFLRSFPVIRNLFRRRIEKINDTKSISSMDYDTFGTYPEFTKGITLQNLIFINPDYESDTFINDYADLQHYTANITVYADSRDTALRFANTVTGKVSLGLAWVGKGNKPKDIDLDVVDTADLDRNVNSQFHGFFNINRNMVDDLYDLIVTGKRADERTTRLKPYAGVFRFTLVPSGVVLV